MCSLSQFPPPPVDGTRTVCEINGQLKTMHEGEVNTWSIIGSHKHLKENSEFSEMDMRSEVSSPRVLQGTQSELTGKSLFLHNELTLWQELFQTCKEDGVLSAVELLALKAYELEAPTRHAVLNKLWSLYFYWSLRATRQTSNIWCWWCGIAPNARDAFTDVADSLVQTRKWKRCMVRCVVWHPDEAIMAVALGDDSVRVFLPGTSCAVTLKNRKQKNLTDMAFCPMAAAVLAIACENGTIIWNIDPPPTDERPSVGTMRLLPSGPAMSLSWSPCGAFLAVANPTRTTVQMWDVYSEERHLIRGRYGSPGGLSLVRWSPTGSHFLTASPSKKFRIWFVEEKWICDDWETSQMPSSSEFEAIDSEIRNSLAARGRLTSGPSSREPLRISPDHSRDPSPEPAESPPPRTTHVSPSRVQCACWSPCGSVLLLALADSAAALVCSVSFTGSKLTDHKVAAVPRIDTSAYTFPSGITVGGNVRSMCWDPTGERLALLFDGSQSRESKCIALFSTSIQPTFTAFPIGFIRGKDSDYPLCMAFQQNCSRGALLTIAWSSGKIANIVLDFDTVANLESDKSVLL